MTDLVERLRLLMEVGEAPKPDLHVYAEAADEIERLWAIVNDQAAAIVQLDADLRRALEPKS